MPDVYRVRLRRKRKRMYLLLPLFAAILYAITCLPGGVEMRVTPATGAWQEIVTREEELPARSYWLVTLGESTERECAIAEGSVYVARGASGHAMRIGGIYRAIGACYTVQEEAVSAAERLANERIPARVCQLSLPAALLQVTATDAQIEALTAADDEALLCATELSALAKAIDAGETDLPGARGALYLRATALKEARTTLDVHVRGEGGPVAEALTQLLQDTESELNALADAGAKARLTLSSRVRLIQARLLDRLYVYRQSLQIQ